MTSIPEKGALCSAELISGLINGTLSHHGIKGMRWGVRRFQNKDGSLTPAGKKRYGSADVKAGSSPERSKPSLLRGKSGGGKKAVRDDRRGARCEDQENAKGKDI